MPGDWKCLEDYLPCPGPEEGRGGWEGSGLKRLEALSCGGETRTREKGKWKCGE